MRSWARWVRAAAARHPTTVDVTLAVALFVFAVAGADLNRRVTGATADAGVGALLAAGMTLPLAARRRVPLPVLVVVAASFLLFRLLEVPEGTISSVALFLALYSAGAYGHPASTRDVVRGLVVVGLLGVLVRNLVDEAAGLAIDVVYLQAFAVGLNLFFFLAAWVLGDLMRTRSQRELLLEERTEELEREREARMHRAVVDERVRIARELHDVVAHHVSLMGVQAAAARRVLRSDPDRAEEALASVEAASRSAVAELQRMLALLRRDDVGPDRAPQPGMRDLPRLADQVRDAGLPVDIVTTGDDVDLPPAVDLTVFRIVQEALTNTLRHAGPAHASVVVDVTGDDVVVEIRDDGRGVGAGAWAHRGHGLAGMRERVGLLDGRLETGPNPGGGFLVRARLPRVVRPRAVVRT